MLLLFLQLLLLLLLYSVPSSSMFSAHAHINGSRFRSQSSATAAAVVDENRRRRRLLHRAPLAPLAPPRLFLFELLEAAKAKLFTREKISYKPNLLRLKLIFATRTRWIECRRHSGDRWFANLIIHTTTKCKESSVIVLDV